MFRVSYISLSHIEINAYSVAVGIGIDQHNRNRPAAVPCRGYQLLQVMNPFGFNLSLTTILPLSRWAIISCCSRLRASCSAWRSNSVCSSFASVSSSLLMSSCGCRVSAPQNSQSVSSRHQSLPQSSPTAALRQFGVHSSAGGKTAEGSSL